MGYPWLWECDGSKKWTSISKGSKLRVACCDAENGELAEDYAKRHNVSMWYDDAEALINDPDVDIIYIATPPGSHKEYTLMAAKAGNRSM